MVPGNAIGHRKCVLAPLADLGMGLEVTVANLISENGQFLLVQATSQFSQLFHNAYNSNFLGLNESPGTEESS